MQDDVFVDEVAARMMVPDFLQYFYEIRFTRFAELFRILYKTLHSVEACFVERFENVERGEQKGARAARRVKDSDAMAEFFVSSLRHAPNNGMPNSA